MDRSMMSIQDAPMNVLILDISGLCAQGSASGSPKVDQTKNHSREDGKVGKVESHRRSRSDGERDVVSGTNHTVESDSSGNDDVSDRTDRQLHPIYFHTRYSR